MPAHRLPKPSGLLFSLQPSDRVFCAEVLDRFHLQEHAINKDQTKGRIEEVKGKIKEVTGKVVGNDDLEAEGKMQKTGGKIQKAYGDLKEDVKDTVKGK